MIRRYLFPFGLVILVSFGGCAPDFPRMNREIEEYRPPAYVQASQDPQKARVPTGEEDGFAEEKKALRAAEAGWEKALKAPERGESFFTPPARLLESLGPAELDPSAAATALSGRFSLETLETLTLLRNPGVKAQENRARAAVDTYSQVMALDDILREYTAFTEGLMTGVGPSRGKEPMKTKFPFPGVLSLKGEIAGQEIRVKMEDLEVAKRDAVTKARVAYWDFLFVRKAEKIARETIGLFRHLERVASARYRTGRASYQDVIKVRIQRETLEEELDTLIEKEQNVVSKILGLLNLPPQTSIGIPKDREPVRTVRSLVLLYPLARERRQELRRLRARVGKMERLIEMAETMILPQYTLGLSFYEDEAVNQAGSLAVKEAFSTSTVASTGYGLPVSQWYGIEDAYLRQTRQELEALRRKLEQEEAATSILVREAWFRLDLAKREEALYRTSILKLSRAALDVSTQGYEAGNVSFADVISSYVSWLNTSLAAQREMSALGTARARLEKVVGVELNPDQEDPR